MLRRLAERKFGAETAARLAGLLDGVTEPERLDAVAEAIIDRESEAAFLATAGDVL